MSTREISGSRFSPEIEKAFADNKDTLSDPEKMKTISQR